MQALFWPLFRSELYNLSTDAAGIGATCLPIAFLEVATYVAALLPAGACQWPWLPTVRLPCPPAAAGGEWVQPSPKLAQPPRMHLPVSKPLGTDCEGCGQPALTLKKCSGCGAVRYCR